MPRKRKPAFRKNQSKLNLLLTAFLAAEIIFVAVYSYRNSVKSRSPASSEPESTCLNDGYRYSVKEAAADPAKCDMEIVSNSDLADLAANSKKLGHVRMVYLKKATETAMPPEIADLKNLKVVIFHHTFKTVIPREIGKLPNLEVLKLEQTDITELPREVGKLSNLKTLIIITNPEPFTLPKEVGRLKKLEVLGLWDNPKVIVEGGAIASPALREINLSNSGQTEIPESVYHIAGLEILDFSLNSISSVGPGLARLGDLKGLNLSGNQLTEIPELSPLRKLTSLQLNNNRFRSVPGGVDTLSGLEFVYLAGNSIPPSEISGLRDRLAGTAVIFDDDTGNL